MCEAVANNTRPGATHVMKLLNILCAALGRRVPVLAQFHIPALPTDHAVFRAFM
jgi:hypothetical protein